MDAVQFGHWLHKRRRSCGFASQHALVERIQQEPKLAQEGISEAFLARLETGQLVHPFRGGVRRRVLVLAELLCHTQRDVSSYIHAAELTELDSKESEQIAQLRKRLSPSQQRMLLLPARPTHIIGRKDAIDELRQALCQKEQTLFLVTGMAGVGKSTLAAEVLYALANDVPQHISFDAIISFSCKGYEGNKGLLALCEHILALFKTHSVFTRKAGKTLRHETSTTSMPEDDDAAVSQAVNQVRHILADCSVLIMLDDLDAHFPLHSALEALGSQQQTAPHAVLATSRYQFAPFAATYRVHLTPLSAPAALEYFSLLLHRSLNNEEQDASQKLCALVGNLPMALESIAAFCTAGVPLTLLYETLTAQSLSSLLVHDYALYTRLKHAFAFLTEEQHKRFSLLSLLDVSSIGQEWATLLLEHETSPVFLSGSLENGSDKNIASANTALEMGNFVRHSLLELSSSHIQDDTQLRYNFHPMLRAYGQRFVQQIEPQKLEAVRGNIRAYALTYLEQHSGSIRLLLRERDMLYACFIDALHDERHGEVMRFVDGLTPISCRLHSRSNGNTLFLKGIQATLYLHDRSQQVRFIHDFGWLCFHWGKLADATHAWTEALDITKSASLGYWLPLLSFAHLAHLQHKNDVAVHYVEEYLHRARNDAPQHQYVYAYLLLALYKRLIGERDDAYEALGTATTLLSSYNFPQKSTFGYFIDKHLRIERARLLGEYAVTQEETELLIAFLEQAEEHYDVASLLLEQATFAQQQGRWEHVPAMALRSKRAAEKVDAAYLRQLSLHLVQHISTENLPLKR